MNRCAVGIVVLGMVLSGGVGWAEELELKPAAVFAYEVPSDFWKGEYAAIKGDSFEEKSMNALTTVEMKALLEMELFTKEKELAKIGLELWKSLPEELSGMEDRPRDRLLKTHQAWKAYIGQQASFIANTTGGGSIYTVIVRQTLVREIEWRIRLYQELLDGKNVMRNELYFYSCKPQENEGRRLNHQPSRARTANGRK